MKLKYLVAIAAALALHGCDAVKQVSSNVYAFTQCKYDYRSISGLNIGGIDVSQGLTLTNAARTAMLFTGQSQSLPLNFTLNVDVSNPTTSQALMHGLSYILNIDGIPFTTGTITNSVNVPAGGSTVMPLTVGVDVMTLMKGDSRDAVVKAVKNFVGLGDESSSVTMQIKPTFMVANIPIESPAYIPISFSFGGKN